MNLAASLDLACSGVACSVTDSRNITLAGNLLTIALNLGNFSGETIDVSALVLASAFAESGVVNGFAFDDPTSVSYFDANGNPVPNVVFFNPDLTVPISQTPLPGGLPLFATGLGALGLLSWRRKQKLASARALASF